MRRTLSSSSVLMLVAIIFVGCEPRSPQAPPTPKTSVATALAPQAAAVGAPAVVPPDFTALVERVGPAVVNVTTNGMRRHPGEGGMRAPDDPLYDLLRGFGPHGGGPRQEELPPRGIGTGFIIDAKGYVLTNAHVVAGADEVTVRLPGSKREHKAKVVGLDRQTDIGLLKIAMRSICRLLHLAIQKS